MKILRNISWPINICLKYFMNPTKIFDLLFFVIISFIIYLLMPDILHQEMFPIRKIQKFFLVLAEFAGSYEVRISQFEKRILTHKGKVFWIT